MDRQDGLILFPDLVSRGNGELEFLTEFTRTDGRTSDLVLDRETLPEGIPPVVRLQWRPAVVVTYPEAGPGEIQPPSGSPSKDRVGYLYFPEEVQEGE